MLAHRRGHLVVYTRILADTSDTVNGCIQMGKKIDVDDLIDANGVAEMLGLAQRNAVSLYQRRYPDMPRPVVDLGAGRCKLWSKNAIQRWVQSR